MTETAPSPAPTRQVPLPGRRVLTVRPMTREDGPALAALYAGLSDRDCYLRFFGARPPSASFVAKMAAVADRGGAGLVATVAGGTGDTSTGDTSIGGTSIGGTSTGDTSTGAGGTGAGGGEDVDAGTRTVGGGRIVAEATYDLLPNGDGELGITVAAGARGWLGPYLLDTLLEVAAQRGVPNLEADVLLVNGRMLAMLRRRGMAVVRTDECPTVVRVVVGTTARLPSWPPRRDGPRVLVETPGGRWRAEGALRAAGYQVMACPGPPGGWTTCPHLRGEPCPLATGADVVVSAVPGEIGRSLVDAHRRSGVHAALCAELADDDADPSPDVRRVRRGAPAATFVELVRELAPSPGRSALEGDARPGAQ